ncbi:maleylacetoacetate isomerase [alpha proteobacterium AAP81b]|nr:maleylacetoacetate isomerase [alpha proteobacterium AAP81b]
MPDLLLYDYWRSSAAFRVRLALAWKGLDWQRVPIDLRHGEQSTAAYRALNPQGLVPLLVNDGQPMAQSLAIMEYLDEVHPSPPLLPVEPLARAKVRAAAQMVACDIHPINNLRVLRYLKDPLGHDQATIDTWARHWIEAGLTALEAFAAQEGGACLWGDMVTIADFCLLPQLYNARRVAADLSRSPRLVAIESRLLLRPEISRAHPDHDPDRTGG